MNENPDPQLLQRELPVLTCGVNELRLLALARFGEVAGGLARDRTKLAAVRETHFKGARTAEWTSEWHRAIGEEILLLAQMKPCLAKEMQKDFLDLEPFGNGPKLKELIALPAAVAVIPVDTDGKRGKGGWMHLWLVRDTDSPLRDDHRRRLEGVERFAPVEGCKVYLVTTVNVSLQTKGKSWQLGAALAARALKPDGREFTHELASRWIVTGEVAGNEQVVPVGLGNKTSIGWKETGRHWIFPGVNRDAPDGHLADPGALFRSEALGRYQFAGKVTGAWRHVTRLGTNDMGTISAWPRNASVFHAFVAGALGPLFASILQSAPKKTILWCSPKMEQEASALRIAAKRLCDLKVLPSPLDIEVRDVASHNVALVERTLADNSSLNEPSFSAGDQLEPVIFNVTSGNLLMRLAAANLAQIKPHLHLIYRDSDDEEATFTLLRYPHGLPDTEKIHIDMSCLGGRVNWRRLLNLRLHLSSAAGYAEQLLEAAEVSEGSAMPNPAFLFGNTFPVSLIRRKVDTERRSLEELKLQLARRACISFWGHENTLEHVNKLLARDLTPKTPRPTLTLDAHKLPMLDGQSFNECWVLSPDCTLEKRPPGGGETSAEDIKSWTVLRMSWPGA